MDQIEAQAAPLRTYGYVRLSDDDGDKGESNSVTGQKALIRGYLSRQPGMRECGMLVDDGFTGSNFERPAFRRLMEEAKRGYVQCIIVKDLSRLGRNYLDTGEYLEKVFPLLGIRFIAINDNYDSARNNPDDHLMIPVKNLFNEAYCRDISIKVRSQLEVKRRKGDFIGAFAVYGYQKAADSKNRLVVDEYAADVVRDIFRWKLEGASPGEIARRLDGAGILSPLEYKRFLGLRASTPFQRNQRAVWSPPAVLRILKNPVYTGVLVQGRDTTVSYKVKKRVKRPEEEWAVLEDHHTPVIPRRDFETVQSLLRRDTRASPGVKTVEPFSGMVFCGECGAGMVRKTIPAASKKYVYYVCAEHKADRTVCGPHRLRAEALSEIAAVSLARCVQVYFGRKSMARLAETARLRQTEAEKFENRLKQKREELARYEKLQASLYEHLADGLLEREEYRELKAAYTSLCEEAKERIEGMEEALRRAANGQNGEQWAAAFENGEGFAAPDRLLAASMIERLAVFRDRRVEITYRWRDPFQARLWATGKEGTGLNGQNFAEKDA